MPARRARAARLVSAAGRSPFDVVWPRVTPCRGGIAVGVDSSVGRRARSARLHRSGVVVGVVHARAAVDATVPMGPFVVVTPARDRGAGAAAGDAGRGTAARSALSAARTAGAPAPDARSCGRACSGPDATTPRRRAAARAAAAPPVVGARARDGTAERGAERARARDADGAIGFLRRNSFLLPN